jgi:6-phosphogluconolactonase
VQWLTGAILQALASSQHITIGLSGGSTPKPIYTLLATEKAIDWKRVTLFLLDERYVPHDHADSNTRMIRETLHNREAAAASLIAPDTSLPLADCIADYDAKIKLIKPDIVILGMGDDAHIASLFPLVDPRAFGPASVIHTTTDRFAVKDRMSVTFPVLLAAKSRVFLITGEKKIALLKKMQRENEDVTLYPAQYLFDERTTWITAP